MFKLTSHQSLVKVNDLDNNNSYLLNNNEDCYKMFFN